MSFCQNRYDRFFANSAIAITESRIDCLNCNMVKNKIYQSDLKCCTFFPFLSNFIVGEILQSHHSLLHEIVKSRKALPFGLVAPPDYQEKFRYKSAFDFGQNDELKCPFLSQDSRCSIWAFRNSNCSSFHCESSHGNDGFRYWKAYQELFHYIEINFSQLAILEMGYDWESVEDNLLWYNSLNSSEGNPFESARVYKKAWDHWWGREEEYFLRVWEWFQSLTFDKFWELMGEEGQKLYGDLQQARLPLKLSHDMTPS